MWYGDRQMGFDNTYAGGHEKPEVPRTYSGAFPRRRGQINSTMVLGIIGGAIIIVGVAWLSWRSASGGSGEQDLPMTLICAACGHAVPTTFTGMTQLVQTAYDQGHTEAGQTPRSPLGLCPKCGKLTLYRAEPCPKCGQPMVPAHARVDGKPVAGGCPTCKTSGKRPEGSAK